METGEKYFIAKITIDSRDAETGKLKKIKEAKLVKGYTPTDVEAKITQLYQGFTEPWRITSIAESTIDEVID